MTNGTSTAVMNETTGKYIITYRQNEKSSTLKLLKDNAGIAAKNVVSSNNFESAAVSTADIPSGGGLVLEKLGMMVVDMPGEAAGTLSALESSASSAILAIEPEGVCYPINQTPALSLDYLRGFRDAAADLYDRASANGSVAMGLAGASFEGTETYTWGLEATGARTSPFSGKGIKVAVLDTGFDLQHPDFVGRSITHQSFVQGQTAQDGHGHGTHCVGTACGPRQPASGRGYGVAHGALIYVGKVLPDQGSGSDSGILAGIEWAITNGCHVISMSLGAGVPSTKTYYEAAGQRALDAGSLIVAAAGNNAARNLGNFGFVSRPANSRSFMAVAALDSRLGIANFSARDTARSAGTAVDIAGPGVNVYSSYPMPTRNHSISGTSMATPHVAGIAALWAEAANVRGSALWQRLITSARTLNLPVNDTGRGLVMAPAADTVIA